jgi:hypothetical protein
MGMAGPAGKFVNLGNKPAAFAGFVAQLGACLDTPAARWGAYVLVCIHDVGKSDAFRQQARPRAQARGGGAARLAGGADAAAAVPACR